MNNKMKRENKEIFIIFITYINISSIVLIYIYISI